MTARLLLPILGLIWFVSELCVTRCCVGRTSGVRAVSKDRGSLSVIGWATVVSLVCGIEVAYHFPACGLPMRHFFLIFGVGLFVVGLALRLCSILYLDRFFTGKVAIAADHRLVDSGPYHFVRHPSYTGALMQFFGLGLGMAVAHRDYPSHVRRLLVAHED